VSFITAWPFPSSPSPTRLLGYCFWFLSFEKKFPFRDSFTSLATTAS